MDTDGLNIFLDIEGFALDKVMVVIGFINIKMSTYLARYINQYHYKSTGKNLSKRALQDLMVLSKKEEFPWLKEVNSKRLLASLEHLDKAYKNIFQGRAKISLAGNLFSVRNMSTLIRKQHLFICRRFQALK